MTVYVVSKIEGEAQGPCVVFSSYETAVAFIESWSPSRYAITICKIDEFAKPYES